MVVWLLIMMLFGGLTAAGQQKPASYGPVPDQRQLNWHTKEFFAQIYHGLNTYTGKECGYGEENPALFRPVALNVNQISRTLKHAGMKGMILVAKHHDGFCLWPTATTPYNIALTPWQNGKGDLVREYADAAQKHDLLFGVYCSPWDRHHALYGTPGYVKVYQEQLRELFTRYGTLFEFQVDSQCQGGEGFYGGAREKREVNHKAYYDWPAIWRLARQLQPQACISSVSGPDCQLCCPNKGRNPATLHAAAVSDSKVETPSGVRESFASEESAGWLACEYHLPLRKTWYWCAGGEATVKTPRQLMEIYFNSVGRGGCLNLGVAPNSNGVLDALDCHVLEAFGNALQRLFAVNLAREAVISASHTRAWQTRADQPHPFAPANVLDDDPCTYWTTDDQVREATLTLNLPAVQEFDVVRLREYIQLGARVKSFVIEVCQKNEWQEYASGDAIGACSLIYGAKVKSDRIRLRFSAVVNPCISEIGLFLMPVISELSKQENR